MGLYGGHCPGFTLAVTTGSVHILIPQKPTQHFLLLGQSASLEQPGGNLSLGHINQLRIAGHFPGLSTLGSPDVSISACGPPVGFSSTHVLAQSSKLFQLLPFPPQPP
jgi:hypothetical protein